VVQLTRVLLSFRVLDVAVRMFCRLRVDTPRYEPTRGLAITHLHGSRGGSRRGSRRTEGPRHGGGRAGDGERDQRSRPQEEHHMQTTHAPSALQLNPRLRLL